MQSVTERQSRTLSGARSAQSDGHIIFGLRYLEETAMELQDIVGCNVVANGGFTFTKIVGSNCPDDSDSRTND